MLRVDQPARSLPNVGVQTGGASPRPGRTVSVGIGQIRRRVPTVETENKTVTVPTVEVEAGPGNAAAPATMTHAGRIAAAVLLPPLGVYLHAGRSGFPGSRGLTVLGFLPGVAFALWSVLAMRQVPAAASAFAEADWALGTCLCPASRTDAHGARRRREAGCGGRSAGRGGRGP